MPNNPLTDAALAELDRLRESVPVNTWGVSKSPRDGRVQVHNGQIQVCAVWSTYTNPAQGTAEYIAALHNAYPPLRQRLTEAESRLADAERERDAMKEHCAMLKRQIRWFLSGAAPCDRGKIWPRSDVDELEASLSVTPDQDLTARDARMKREGTPVYLESLEELDAARGAK